MSEPGRLVGEAIADTSGSITRSRLRLDCWDWFTLLLPMLAISPLLYRQANFLWAKQHLQFFPLAFAAAAWFLYQEGHIGHSISKVRRASAVVAANFGILICYSSLAMYSSWLAHLAVIVLTFSWSLGKLGNLSVLRIVGICGLLAVALPPPNNGDQKIVVALQSLSTTVSNHLMDVTQIIHVRSGNVIDIASKSLFVEEACSGVDSQYALMAVAGVMLLIGRAGLVVSLITIVTVPLWAILGNLLRIYSIVIGLEWFGVDLASGSSHTILGLITFSLAAWAHWSSVQFLNFMSMRYSSPLAIAQKSPMQTLDGKPLSAMSHWTLLFPALMLVMMPASFVGAIALHIPLPTVTPEISLALPLESDLPRSLYLSRRVRFSTADRVKDQAGLMGQHSRIWTYEMDDVSQNVSLDMPFRGWHALWLCYEATGWTVLSSNQIQIDSNGEPLTWPYFEINLQNQVGEFAVLHFALFDEEGKPFLFDLENVKNTALNRWSRSIFPNSIAFFKGERSPFDPLTFQFQIMSQSMEPATPELLQEYRKIFLDLRNAVRDKSMPGIRKLTNK